MGKWIDRLRKRAKIFQIPTRKALTKPTEGAFVSSVGSLTVEYVEIFMNRTKGLAIRKLDPQNRHPLGLD